MDRAETAAAVGAVVESLTVFVLAFDVKIPPQSCIFHHQYFALRIFLHCGLLIPLDGRSHLQTSTLCWVQIVNMVVSCSDERTSRPTLFAQIAEQNRPLPYLPACFSWQFSQN